jgi:hypothetical protein
VVEQHASVIEPEPRVAVLEADLDQGLPEVPPKID